MTNLELGEKIIARRTELGMSQAHIARALKTSAQNYGQYEKGERDFTVTQIKTLCVILGVKWSWFFDDVEYTDDDEIITYWRGMPQQLQPAAKSVLKTMYDQQDRSEITHGKRTRDDQD